MTTADTPRNILEKQARKIARKLKLLEQNKLPLHENHERLIAARKKDHIKFGIVMDDKLVTITIPWKVIDETEEEALVEYIIKQMQEKPDN